MLKRDGQSRIVMITCGTIMEARRIARRVVSNNLAACVNIVQSSVESVYSWKGKVEKAREYLLVMKTTAKRLADLEREVGRYTAISCRNSSRCRLPRARKNIFPGWMTTSRKPVKGANSLRYS